MQNKRSLFYLLMGLGIMAAMYLTSIGGFHRSPQKVFLRPGMSKVVANGRAQITVGQVVGNVPVEVLCRKEKESLLLQIGEAPSGSVCGIQTRVLEITTGQTGMPLAVLEVSWN